MGFLLLGYELTFSLNNQLTPQEEIKRESNPLWSIEIKQPIFGVYKDLDE
jgi:hypothetical protein